MQKCTPIGYLLHVASDIVGLVSLILLIGAVVYLAWRGLHGTFHASLVLLVAAPIALAVVGRVMHAWSWRIAAKRNFKYDYDKRLATWTENGRERSYKFGQEA